MLVLTWSSFVGAYVIKLVLCVGAYVVKPVLCVGAYVVKLVLCVGAYIGQACAVCRCLRWSSLCCV